METHYSPSTNPDTRCLLAQARRSLADAREAEGVLGASSPENEPVTDHLQCAIGSLIGGLEQGDDEAIAEGICMVQDAELRLRCNDGTPVASSEIRETMQRIRDFVRATQGGKNPPPWMAGAFGVVEALLWVLGSPDPDNFVRMLLKQARKVEGVAAWRAKGERSA